MNIDHAWKSSAARLPNASTKIVAQLKKIALGIGSRASASVICAMVRFRLRSGLWFRFRSGVWVKVGTWGCLGGGRNVCAKAGFSCSSGCGSAYCARGRGVFACALFCVTSPTG